MTVIYTGLDPCGTCGHRLDLHDWDTTHRNDTCREPGCRCDRVTHHRETAR
jgi:hypothetical protein